MAVKFSFYCKKCGQKDVPYELREGVASCDTPIGTVEDATKKAYCLQCGEELFCKELRNLNYMSMVKATMGLWRSKNPAGTRKQCRRALGLTQETVSHFWDICLEDVPKLYPESENDAKGEDDCGESVQEEKSKA